MYHLYFLKETHYRFIGELRTQKSAVLLSISLLLGVWRNPDLRHDIKAHAMHGHSIRHYFRSLIVAKLSQEK